jgi:glutaredoxin
MKAYRGIDVKIHILLSSAIIRGKQSISLPYLFILGNEPVVPIGEEVG